MTKIGMTRRGLLLGSAAAATAGLLSSVKGIAAAAPESGSVESARAGNLGYVPVVTPNGVTLDWQMVDGVKVYHLTAEPIRHEIAPGLVIDGWGYNGRSPGPTIEAVEGDHLRIYVTNNLPEPTTVHWHGIFLPNGMDGVAGLTQKPIPPGETFRYEFTLRQHGTFMYHPHYDEMVQMALGMMGMFVVHPKERGPDSPDRDFAIMLSEWLIKPGTTRPDPMAMSDFNILTMNSRAFPGTEPLVVRKGDRVRIRLGNLSAMDHHSMHIHGHRFHVVETDGGQIPESARWPETTVLVAVGSTRAIELIADAEGDWPFHCHMTHHTMNQMGHGLPNLIGSDAGSIDEKANMLLPEYMTMGESGMGEHGAHMQHMELPENSIPMRGSPGPFSYIDMGGMFTILKIRDGISSFEDPGWFKHPGGTVASAATADELKRDGVKIRKAAKQARSERKSNGHHGHHGHE